MSKYQTRPLRQLKEFLSAHPQESFTVEDLTDALAGEYGESAPGKSTLYRLLPRLEEEQTVKRFEKEGSHRPYYQIVGCAHDHLHLKCTGCGRLFHMKETASAQLLKEVLNSADFTVDQHQTVLFGKCADCK